jgi:hypothetical protein
MLATGQSIVSYTSLQQNIPPRTTFRSPFRYVIFEDKQTNPTNTDETSLRVISVLMDKVAFSESNLIELFSLISKRYPAPKRLDIWVFTSLEQVSTPEERDVGYTSGDNDRKEMDFHHLAIFIRSADGTELFRYSTKLPANKLKTVILREKRDR